MRRVVLGFLVSITALPVTGSVTGLDTEVRGAKLEGRVLDAVTSTPVQNVALRLTGPADFSRMPIETDVDGSFVFDDVPPGAYHVHATAPHYEATVRSLSITDDLTHAIKLRLRPASRTDVRFIDDATGAALDFVRVTVENGKQILAFSGELLQDGERGATLWLFPGSYSMHVIAGDFVHQTVPLSVPGPQTTIALTRGGRILTSGGRAGASHMRLVNMQTGKPGRGRLISSGGFSGVPAGVYKLELLDEQQSVVASYTVIVNRGETSAVPLD